MSKKPRLPVKEENKGTQIICTVSIILPSVSLS